MAGPLGTWSKAKMFLVDKTEGTTSNRPLRLPLSVPFSVSLSLSLRLPRSLPSSPPPPLVPPEHAPKARAEAVTSYYRVLSLHGCDSQQGTSPQSGHKTPTGQSTRARILPPVGKSFFLPNLHALSCSFSVFHGLLSISSHFST